MSLLSERRNLIRFIYRHPLKLIPIFIKAFCIPLSAIYRRIASDCERRRFQKTFAKSGSSRELNLLILPEPGLEEPQAIGIPKHATLATSVISLECDVNWHQTFPDIEDTLSLHRFGWLLTVLLDHPHAGMAEKAIYWINDWINCMEERKNHPAWESYSIAERLSNWPFILRIIQSLVPLRENFLVSVEKAMSVHIDRLVSRVEFRGAYTNNHIINDARGLYIGGVILNDASAVNAAKKIFYEWSEKLFSSEGMLKENSTHYQYLLYQRYEQVFFISRLTGDKEFCVFLSDWMKRIKAGCIFFDIVNSKGEHHIPLIGDISPDFPPDWLILQEQGWAKLKKLFRFQFEGCDISYRNTSSIRKMEPWIRYQFKNITLFWHIQTDSFNYINHGHYDFGSFVLYIDGNPMLIDPGLYSYSNEGAYGKYARSHSTVMIDSLGAFCEDSQIRSLDVYPDPVVEYHVSEQKNEFVKLELFSNGFSRLSDPLKWKRTFTVESGRLSISDAIQCDGHHHLENRFQIHPNCDVTSVDGDILFSCNDISMRMLAPECSADNCSVISGDQNSEEGWISERYGFRSPSKCLLFKHDITTNQIFNFEFRWN